MIGDFDTLDHAIGANLDAVADFAIDDLAVRPDRDSLAQVDLSRHHYVDVENTVFPKAQAPPKIKTRGIP